MRGLLGLEGVGVLEFIVGLVHDSLATMIVAVVTIVTTRFSEATISG